MEDIFHVIRRLMAGKGQASQIIFDSGTQLKGAAYKLGNVWKGWNEADLVRFGTIQGLEWKFTMAASQHQAGAVEIMIKICSQLENEYLSPNCLLLGRCSEKNQLRSLPGQNQL